MTRINEESEKRCINCMWYVGGKHTQGQCQRHAPVVAEKWLKKLEIWAEFPFVGRWDWCGDFKKIKSEKGK